ncbi:MAG: 50S ribosomal protein L3 [Gemmataceae bacterium]
MALGMLGYKVGMTQIFTEEGDVIPVTVLQLGPCPVLMIRDKDRDGYEAIQVGVGEKKREKATRAERGHVSADMESKRRQTPGSKPLGPKPDCEPPRKIREFRLETPATEVMVSKLKTPQEGEEPEYEQVPVEVGLILDVKGVFTDIPAVDVIGTTKGRGYTGAMKAWGFRGMPASHGSKKNHRQIGSTASNCSNRGLGRPKKGRKAPGQYGNRRKTIRNLKVIEINEEENLLLVKGAVPGPNGGFLMVRPTNKASSSHLRAAREAKK